MSLPVILAVDDETDVSEELHRDLTKRYSADYAIRSATSPDDALDWLRQAQETRSVTVVIVSLRMAAMSGIDFLIRAHELHPGALDRDPQGYILTGMDLWDPGGAQPSRWPDRRAPMPRETSVRGIFAAAMCIRTQPTASPRPWATGRSRSRWPTNTLRNGRWSLRSHTSR